MKSTRLLAALLGVALALCLAGLAYWRLVPMAPPPPPLPDPVAIDEPATLEAALPMLQRQADAWLPGATPVGDLGTQRRTVVRHPVGRGRGVHPDRVLAENAAVCSDQPEVPGGATHPGHCLGDRMQ